MSALATAPPAEQARILTALGVQEGSLFGGAGDDKHNDAIAMLCNAAGTKRGMDAADSADNEFF